MRSSELSNIKKEIRIIAWDDASFNRNQKRVLVVGVVFRGGSFLDGLLSAIVEKDGNDATEKIVEIITNSSHHDQLSVIMLNGITFAGFNVVDIKKLNKLTKLPVIVVQRKMPDLKRFSRTLMIFPDKDKKSSAYRNAGDFKSVKINNKILFYQSRGIGKDAVEQILKITCIRSTIPEPLRQAHLIASGLKWCE